MYLNQNFNVLHTRKSMCYFTVYGSLNQITVKGAYLKCSKENLFVVLPTLRFLTIAKAALISSDDTDWEKETKKGKLFFDQKKREDDEYGRPNFG